MERIIHQTWKDENIPDCYPHVWQESWRRDYPEWEYRFWTDEDNQELVSTFYREFEGTYDKIARGVVKSDIARMLYLHRFGGIYADLDFVSLRSIEPLLAELSDFIVVGKHDQPKQPFPNAWMYSPPDLDFWLALVEDSLRDWRQGQRKVECIAGPDRLKWGLQKYKPDHVALPYPCIYPHPWGNSTAASLARSIDWQDLDQLRDAYPQGYAVTKWRHNW